MLSDACLMRNWIPAPVPSPSHSVHRAACSKRPFPGMLCLHPRDQLHRCTAAPVPLPSCTACLLPAIIVLRHEIVPSLVPSMCGGKAGPLRPQSPRRERPCCIDCIGCCQSCTHWCSIDVTWFNSPEFAMLLLSSIRLRQLGRSYGVLDHIL